ncbi:MAG: SRPBCC family protein [Acidimicrobiia bacterium]|nr:SRPBCC family protein [Acidimicrobiia bacterium]
MRFADRPSLEKGVVIDASPETVWAICIDLPRFGEWSPENRGGEWLDGAGPALGSKFLGRQEHPGRGEWETTCTVSTFEPNRAFAWTLGELDNPGAVWGFELTGEGSGTRLRQHVAMGPGPSGITDVIAAMPDKEERIIERRLQEYDAGLTAVLNGVKAAAEA